MPETVDYDVIIIGAGVSGLSAAFHLKKTFPEVKYKILEARSRVGGRTFAVDMKVSGGRTQKFDIGGQWVGPVQIDLLELLEELGLSDKLYLQYLAGTKVCWVEPGRITKYTTELPLYNPLLYLECYTFFKKIDYFADELDANNPFLRNPALADYLDSMTFESLIRQHIYNPTLRELIRIGIRTVFGYEASQISALYCILYAKSSGKMENLVSSGKDGAQKMKLSGSMYQLSHRLKDFVGEENIFYESPVTNIEQNGSKVTVTFSKGSSLARLTAKKVICAIPPPHLLKLDLKPPLPATRVELLKAMPMSNLFKFVVTYEKAFWREKNLSGETTCYGADVELADQDDCPVGPVSVTFDQTLPDGSPAIVGFSAAYQTVCWDKKPFEVRKKAILKTLAKMLGEEALQPLDYQEKNWAHEEWTGGCPVACLQPGAGRLFTPGMRLPYENIHMAGTETAQRSIGYISGAVQAGRRAAVEVLYSLGKHSPKDAAILASTCHGPAGRAQRWTVKWPTVNDPCMLTLQSSNWGYKAVAAVSLGFLLYRYLWPKNGDSIFKCDRFTKYLAW